jgi:hypothetical protein
LDLSGNGFGGEISVLSALTNLEHLDLHTSFELFTFFTGDISAFSGLTKLTNLSICSNNQVDSFSVAHTASIGGDLAALSNLTKLQWLDLGNQNVTGSLGALSSKLLQLSHLDLSWGVNQITFGEAALNFPQLIHLDLGWPRQYWGANVGRWSQLSDLTQLTSLNLRSWIMSGRISDGLSNLKQLTHLAFGASSVEGTIVQLGDISHLTQLTYLSMGRPISGRLEDLSNLTQLEYLDVGYCDLGGSIPSSLMRMSRLKVFDAYCNGFTGVVPPLPVFRIPDPDPDQHSCDLNEGSGCSLRYTDTQSRPNVFQCPLPPGAKENCHGICTKGGQLQRTQALPAPKAH